MRPTILLLGTEAIAELERSAVASATRAGTSLADLPVAGGGRWSAMPDHADQGEQ